jgi:hypothetical protein
MEAIMRESDDGKSSRNTVRLRLAKLAHLTERVGLAMVGASCGLFVAVGASHASFETQRSLGVSLAMITIGAIGFYLGIDIPSGTTQPGEYPHLGAGKTKTIDPVEMLSAAGTFLAATAVMTSVCFIVLDTDVRITWTLALGSSWLIGAAMQVIAGTVARFRNSTRVGRDDVGNGKARRRKAPALWPASF